MTKQDSAVFTERLMILAELHDKVPSDGIIALYFDALKDLPLERVLFALDKAVKACTFMPKPAELRGFAIGDEETDIERLWIAFKTAMRVVGAYSSLATEDAALGQSIIALFQSWPAACTIDLTPEMWAAKRKEFGRVMRVMKDRQLTGTAFLPGLTELENYDREALRHVPIGIIDSQFEIRRLYGADAVAYRHTLETTDQKELSDGGEPF